MGNIKVLEMDGGDGGVDALRHGKSEEAPQPLENLPRKFKDSGSDPQHSFERKQNRECWYLPVSPAPGLGWNGDRDRRMSLARQLN